MILYCYKNRLRNSILQSLPWLLPFYLLPSSPLLHWNKTIAQIDLTLQQRYSDVHLTYHNPDHYYAKPNFLYFRNGSDLCVTVKFPLSPTFLDFLHAYTVTTFPVPFHNDSSLFTILFTSVHHLLISDSAPYFAELNQQPPVFDKFSFDTVRSRVRPTCLFALFEDVAQQIKSLYNFQVISSTTLVPDLYVLNYPEILIRNAPNLSVSCPYSLLTPNSCFYCFYTIIPCGCSVSTPLTFLPPRMTHCNSTSDSPFTTLPQYPVNLALVHHFFENDTLGTFSGDTLLTQPLSVQLPPMKFFNPSTTNWPLHTTLAIS